METRLFRRSFVVVVLAALLFMPLLFTATNVQAKEIQLSVRVQYYDPHYSAWKDAKEIRVELRTSGGSTVAHYWTDMTGRVYFQPSSGSYKVVAMLQDDRCIRVVNTSTSNTYEFSSSTFYYDDMVGKSMTMQFNGGRSNMFCCYEGFRTAFTWLTAKNVGWAPPEVLAAYYPQGDWMSFKWNTFIPSNHWIELGGLDDYSYLSDPAVAIHEYGHYVMFESRGHNFPGYDLFDGPSSHNPFTEADDASTWLDPDLVNWGFAFIEGWAEYFSCTVHGDATAAGWGSAEYGGYSYSSLYADGHDTGDQDGWDVEGAVMSALWDLDDGANSNDKRTGATWGDNITARFSDIWHMVITHQANNMLGVYNQWVSHYSGDRQSLDAILLNHRMNPYNTGNDS